MAAGTETMSAARKSDLDRRYERYLKNPGPGTIRIEPRTDSHQQTGTSADELVATRILHKQASKMRPAEKEMAYRQREDQGYLGWATGSAVLSDTYGRQAKRARKDPAPVAAHTPALKTRLGGGTSGAVTAEHTMRDRLREAAVAKTLADPHRADADVSIVSQLATAQVMSSPLPELQARRASVTAPGAGSLHSSSRAAGDISTPAGFDRWADGVHERRERRKMQTARALQLTGRDALVPPAHASLLSAAGGSVDRAFEELRKRSHSASPGMTFNTAGSSQTDRLDTHSLSEMDARARSGTRVRALSPPRPLPVLPAKL